LSLAFYEKIDELLKNGQSFVVATVVDASGSVPQDVGAKMIVDEGGRLYGTVGGGKVEGRAIREAQELLSELGSNERVVSQKTRFCNWNLQKDIGMTCGGSVRIYFEAQNLATWQIVVFGAGHCAIELTNLLSRLDCSVTCIDHRREWLDKIVQSPRVKKVLVNEYLEYVDKILPLSFVLLMTMGHSSDKPILLDILRRYSQGLKAYPYLGVIGSKAKAHRLHQDIAEAGLNDDHPFFCPVGLPIGSNDPAEIAVSITAQLVQEREKYFSACNIAQTPCLEES
jgi:xanthine dehydrogenase accessory factor